MSYKDQKHARLQNVEVSEAGIRRFRIRAYGIGAELRPRMGNGSFDPDIYDIFTISYSSGRMLEFPLHLRTELWKLIRAVSQIHEFEGEFEG